MAGTTNWDQNTNKFDKVLTVDNFTAITPSGSIVFSATANPVITGTIDIENMSISGNLTVAGTATFNKIISVTSSYSSGSTIFGDALVDTHQFTGSVFITGSSFNWNNSRVITSNITSSMSVASASQALTASFYNGSVTSASYASQAGNSSTIDINVFGSPVDSYLLMSNVAGTTGVAIGGDAELRYNSSTNVLSVPNISATTLTGSLLGTASNAISALTASKLFVTNLAIDAGTYYPMFANTTFGAANLFADAATYTYQPSTNILTVTASLSLGVSASSINSNNSKLYGSSNVESIDWNARTTYDTSNVKSIGWDDRALFDTSGNTVVTWVSGSLVGTGSLQGTSSWATNALTASRVPSYETAWTSYTPIWTTDGTQPTLGDGLITGAYKLIGKTCFVRVRLYWGTTTNSGTGVFYFSLPVSASSTWGIQMPASMLDNGNAWYQATVNGEYGGFTNRTALIGQSAGGANSSQGVTGVFPFTFGNLDSIQFNGSYETI